MRRSVVTVVALAILAGCAATDPIADPVTFATETADALQRRSAPPTQKEADEIPMRLARARAAIDGYVETQPGDSAGWTAAARIELASASLRGISVEGDQMTDVRVGYQSVLDKLDRALALDPHDAEALYWKARVYLSPVPKLLPTVYQPELTTTSFEPLDAAEALRFAAAALTEDPSNAIYQETLAMVHVERGRFGEAQKVLAQSNVGPELKTLLNDFAKFPLPPGAIHSPRCTHEAVRYFSEYRSVPLLGARAVCFLVPGDAVAIERFYKQTWPDFRLEPIRALYWGAYLAPSGDGWMPGGDIASMPELEDMDGMNLAVFESLDLTDDQRARVGWGEPLPASFGDTVTQIRLSNFRH